MKIAPERPIHSRRPCEADATCDRPALPHERTCFDHLASVSVVVTEADARLAQIMGERDRDVRLSEAELARDIGSLIAPGLARALAVYELGPSVRVCRHGACGRTQVYGSPYCRIHGGWADAR